MTESPQPQIRDINSQVAQFRDLLISIGQPCDGLELRERIRELHLIRRSCIEACKNTSQLILPQVRRTMDIGIPADCPNLEHLFHVTQLFLRELCKNKNLVQRNPISKYNECRTGPSRIGNVITQIAMCTKITVDFKEEELCSIRKDSEEIKGLIDELQEFMPKANKDTEKYTALQETGVRGNHSNGARRVQRWNNPTRPRQTSYFRGAFKIFCC